MAELWKPIQGYEGIYAVSNLGRVKSLERTTSGKYGTPRQQKERILAQTLRQDGYLTVNLCKDLKQKCFYVHRLVAIAFTPNPLCLPFVNHKDEEKNNNAAVNLEWCTATYNLNYGTARERRIMANTKGIWQINAGGEKVRIYRGLHEVGAYGYSRDAVKKCCQGRQVSYMGYFWRYAE